MGSESIEYRKIAQRYAKAFFDYLIEKNEKRIKPVYQDTQRLQNIISENHELSSVLSSQIISPEQKRKALIEISQKSKLCEEVFYLIELSASHNRMNALAMILISFEERVKEYEHILKAEVISAITLKKEQIERIKSILSKKFDAQIELETIIDPSVIGGLSIKMGSNFFDNTLDTQLNNLHLSIKEVA